MTVRQPLPRTPEAARAELWIYQEKLTLAQIQYQASRRALDLARDNLRAVEGISRGEFDDSAEPEFEVGFYGVRRVREHACGSRGTWSWQV